MPKTVTLRMDDKIYGMVKKRANSDHRPISNFIEHALRRYMEESDFTDDSETLEILGNPKLVARLRQGSRDAESKKGRFVA